VPPGNEPVRSAPLEDVVVGEFAAVLRQQIVAARQELEAAREAGEPAGIKSYGLRLRYLLDVAEEHHIDVEHVDAPGER
jgi:hypothetical protein